jgi:hypothetical protein
MAYPSIFDQVTNNQLVQRVEKLSSSTPAQWGKMNVAQMLAHCNVTYDLAKGNVSGNNNALAKFFLKLFVKNIVVGEKPYAKNSRTAPIFIVADQQDFEKQKQLIIQNTKEVQAQGAKYYDGKMSDSFGKLTATEWSNMFYKHLDHHLTQFGV